LSDGTQPSGLEAARLLSSALEVRH
jgi:hypothetical protein